MQKVQMPMTDTRHSDQVTNWRAVWRLLKPYWVSEEKWKARGLLAAVVALALGMVYLNVLFNEWNRVFYNALESKDFVTFKGQLWRFSYLAFIYIGVAIYKVYLTQALEIRWRGWMTRQYMDGWLSRQVYYRIEQASSADNPDQRIAEDLKFLTNGSLTLSLGLRYELTPPFLDTKGDLFTVYLPHIVFGGRATRRTTRISFARATAPILTRASTSSGQRRRPCAATAS